MLKVEAIEVAYAETRVLNQLTVAVGDGQVVCVMGRNGVGKTTLLKAVVGLVPARRGTIAFDGTDVTRLAPYERARLGIGYVPQGREIFPGLTVLQNLAVGARRKQPAPASLDYVVSLFPALAGMLGKRGGDLSGGQQQQLAIARALVARPDVLLLDEPSLGLAPTIVERLFETLGEIRERGVAILLVEQRAQLTIAFADRTHVIANGKLRLTLGPHEAGDVDRLTTAYLS